MKKSKQEHKSYYSVSQNEAFVLSLIKTNGFNVFGIRELHSLSSWSKTRLHNTLFSLVKKNMLTRIKRNVYSITEHLNENIFQISTEMVVPSYISFWTALSYYGFTEQQIQTIQLISTKQARDVKFNKYKIQIITFQPREFYGYKKFNGFVIAEKEKALIDSLFQLKRCGGLNEYVKCLNNAWIELDKKRFIRYLKMFNNKSLISRMGYIVEQLKLSNTQIIKELEKHKSLSPIKLNPSNQRTGEYNRKWNVLINDSIYMEDIK